MSGNPVSQANTCVGTLQPGTRVRHWQFGTGTVTVAEEDDVVMVQFEHHGSKRMCVSMARLEILHRPSRPALSQRERAARLASHLRRLALLLRERGLNAPPLPAQTHLWLMQLIDTHEWRRQLFLSWLRLIRQEEEYEAELPEKTMDMIIHTIRHLELGGRGNNFLDAVPDNQRVGRWARRWTLDDPEHAVALNAQHYESSASLYEATAYWLADPAYRQLVLTASSADRAEQLAALIEKSVGLPPCPPRWGPRPAGPWKGVIYSLVMHCANLDMVWQDWARKNRRAVRMDVMAGTIEPAEAEALMLFDLRSSALHLLEKASRRIGEPLRHARIEFLPSPKGRERYRVELETLNSGIGTECVLEYCGPLRYRWINPKTI